MTLRKVPKLAPQSSQTRQKPAKTAPAQRAKPPATKAASKKTVQRRREASDSEAVRSAARDALVRAIVLRRKREKRKRGEKGYVVAREVVEELKPRSIRGECELIGERMVEKIMARVIKKPGRKKQKMQGAPNAEDSRPAPVWNI